jgi:hypothetical protein
MTEIVKIYKLSNLTKFVYIGSTIKKLNVRLINHKNGLKRFLEGKERGYCRSYDIIAFGNYKIELLEVCKVKDRDKRERWWVENTQNVVNKLIPGRKHKEYREDNKKEIAIKKTKKYECECSGKYICAGKARHVKTKKHQDWLHTNP